MSVNSHFQKLLFPDVEADLLRDETASTFVDNMGLPVHRWFRFSAGFSAQWVERVIADAQRSGPVRVLDPFAGAGTTLIAAEQLGAECYGIEAHPFVARIARAKLLYRESPNVFLERARETQRRATLLPSQTEGYPPLIQKCFRQEALADLDRLRQPGQAEAWNRFVALYTPLLLYWARRARLQPQDAADLVQDVFTTLVRKLPEFRYEPGRSFNGWLRAIILNKWRDRERQWQPNTAAGAAGTNCCLAGTSDEWIPSIPLHP